MRSPFISGASLRTEIVLLPPLCHSTRHARIMADISCRMGACCLPTDSVPSKMWCLHRAQFFLQIGNLLCLI